MMMNRKIRFRIACTLAFGLAVCLVGPCRFGSHTEAKSVTSYVSAESDSGVFRYLKVINPADSSSSYKYDSSDIAARKVETIANDDKYINALGSTMSTQLLSFLGNQSASSAYISDVSGSELSALNAELTSGGYQADYRDIVTKIRFTIPAGTLPSNVISSSSALFYIEQAISRFPTLCCLFTMAKLDNTSNTLTVYSPIAKNSLYDTIAKYSTTLSDMLKVPRANAASMNEADKLLYIHDQVVAITEYSVSRTGIYAGDYIPAAAMLGNLATCQSYAAVFNQAARELGLTSYVLYSDNHAWVAVRLGGLWYYVDPTWDDTRIVGEGADKVSHKYVFVGKNGDSNFFQTHTLTRDYASHFSEITGSLGAAYDSYYPKENNITSQMGYANGGFYYSDGIGVYQWRRSDNKKTTLTGLDSAASSKRVAVLDGYLYISGSTGIYKMDPVGNTAPKIDSNSYTGMYEAARKLYVSKGDAFYVYSDLSSQVSSPSPVTSPTPLPSGYSPSPGASSSPYGSASPYSSASPTATNKYAIPTASYSTYDPQVVTPTPSGYVTPAPTATSYTDNGSFTAPKKTTIQKLTNSATRAAYIKWKKIGGATRYQVQYSPSKNFNTKQIRVSMTSSVTIANLFKKTYYFRVRAVKIKRVNGVIAYKYGPWSAKKKLKIRK